MNAWEVYLSELRQRADGAERQQFERRERLMEAAHDAYQAAADRLTQHGWEDDHTLVVMRGLSGAVQEWLGRPGADWESLGAEMRRREGELRDGFHPGARTGRR